MIQSVSHLQHSLFSLIIVSANLFGQFLGVVKSVHFFVVSAASLCFPLISFSPLLLSSFPPLAPSASGWTSSRLVFVKFVPLTSFSCHVVFFTCLCFFSWEWFNPRRLFSRESGCLFLPLLLSLRPGFCIFSIFPWIWQEEEKEAERIMGNAIKNKWLSFWMKASFFGKARNSLVYSSLILHFLLPSRYYVVVLKVAYGDFLFKDTAVHLGSQNDEFMQSVK